MYVSTWHYRSKNQLLLAFFWFQETHERNAPLASVCKCLLDVYFWQVLQLLIGLFHLWQQLPAASQAEWWEWTKSVDFNQLKDTKKSADKPRSLIILLRSNENDQFGVRHSGFSLCLKRTP